MPSLRYHHTHLTSTDPEKMVDLLSKLVGAQVTNRPIIQGQEMIDLDLCGLATRISRSTGADSNWKGLKHGLHHLGLTVDDLDAVARQIRDAGVEFVVEPTSNASGVKSAFIQLDNVLIEIIQF